ncbi:MAG: outer membrane beta-barrel protein [Gemmatimonadota bacterium]
MSRNFRAPLAAAILALAAALSGAGTAQAQVGIALGGGPSFPLGTLGESVETGYNAQLSATLSVPLIPIAVQLDGMFNQFPAEGEGGDYRILSGSVNGVLSMPSIGITPYVIGGVGFYNSRYSDDPGAGPDSESSTDAGVNIGAGVRVGLAGLAVFGEARLHNIFSDGDSQRFAPVTLGVRF